MQPLSLSTAPTTRITLNCCFPSFSGMSGQPIRGGARPAGLVERAHEGILFLDEIHRLSPEGQEKLFLLMVKGFFPAGEAKSPRRAVY